MTTAALAGLPNRRLLLERVYQAQRDAGRTCTGLVVVFVDLEETNVGNGTRCNTSGERLLRTVGTELLGAFRPEDTVARYGDDEFVVLCENANRTLETMMRERVRLAVERAVRSMPFDIDVTASIGVARSAGEANPTEILVAADASMKEATRLTLRHRAEPRLVSGRHRRSLATV